MVVCSCLELQTGQHEGGPTGGRHDLLKSGIATTPLNLTSLWIEHLQEDSASLLDEWPSGRCLVPDSKEVDAMSDCID